MTWCAKRKRRVLKCRSSPNRSFALNGSSPAVWYDGKNWNVNPPGNPLTSQAFYPLRNYAVTHCEFSETCWYDFSEGRWSGAISTSCLIGSKELAMAFASSLSKKSAKVVEYSIVQTGEIES